MKCLGFVLLLLALASCRCEELNCPGLDPASASWLRYRTGENISFENNMGDEVSFVVFEENFSANHNNCKSELFGGCACGECPLPRGGFTSRTQDTGWRIVNSRGETAKYFNLLSTSVTKTEQESDSIRLRYSILDHNNSFLIAPLLTLESGDSLLPSFSVGGNVYSNVILHEVDTTVVIGPNPIYNVYFVWKSYYCKDFGLIAFYDLRSQSLFYRKP